MTNIVTLTSPTDSISFAESELTKAASMACVSVDEMIGYYNHYVVPVAKFDEDIHISDRAIGGWIQVGEFVAIIGETAIEHGPPELYLEFPEFDSFDSTFE